MLRAGAYLIDLLIRGAVLVIGGMLLSLAGFGIGIQVAGGMFLLAWFLLDWIYPVVFEAGKRGATPGKRMMGLRVVQSTGSPITLGQAVVRNFLRFIDGMPFFTYMFGMTSCMATQRFQRLGDLAAGTVVIYDRLPPMPQIGVPPPVNAVPLPVGPVTRTIPLGLYSSAWNLFRTSSLMPIFSSPRRIFPVSKSLITTFSP